MNSQAISQTIACHTKTKSALPQSILRMVLESLRRFRTWRDRRLAVRDLERLDDRLLADIGLDRGQIRFMIDGLAAAPRRAGHDHARRQSPRRIHVSTDISRMTTRGHR